MNIRFSLAASCLVSSLLCSNAFASDADKKALQQKLAQLQSLSTEFSQTLVDAEGLLLQQHHGKLSLQQPQKLYWEVYEPTESLMIADGSTLWQVDPMVEQVIAIDQQQAIANNPMVLLTSNDPNDWAGFTVSQNQQQWLIKALAEDSIMVSLVLEFKGEQLSGFTTTDRQGLVSTYSFSDVKQNQPVEQSLFVFKLPEGYDLDDQRN